ncbi:MAG: NADH-quinone oxidoreductase subunit C [Cyclobacteriaceae bacterium]
MKSFEEIKELLLSTFGEEIILGDDLNCTPNAILVDPKKIDIVGQELQNNEATYFDSLSCLTGLDNGPEKDTMEVIYNLFSIPYEVSLTLKVELARDNPRLPTVSTLWRTADWHEREAFDLLGIEFEGHLDLRRILMPADWEGHPLRKDYAEPERYRGMETVRNEDE